MVSEESSPITREGYLVLKVEAIRVDHLGVGRTGVDATSKDPSGLVQGHRLVGCTMCFYHCQ